MTTNPPTLPPAPAAPSVFDTLLAAASRAQAVLPAKPTSAWPLPVSEKQARLIQLCHRPGRARYILVSGPRKSTKTMACLHAIVDHLWNVRSASFSVITPTVTAGDDQGCWALLTKDIVPQWVAGSFGLRWVTAPRESGSTKKKYFEITNRFGGTSRCQLDSLEYEKDAEARFKNKYYSGIYVSELSYYKKKDTYTNWTMCLRGPNWTEDDLVFIGDTNPAEEGEDSWIWKHWYQFRTEDNVDDAAKATQARMALMEFSIQDNIWMSKGEIDLVLDAYSHSEDLLKRYRDGLWVKSTENSIFFEHFRPNLHIAGEYETRENPEPEVLLPEENCWQLGTGWDMGSANSAFLIYEKVMAPLSPTVSVSLFKILDEVLYLGDTDTDELSLVDFIKECYEKILYWEHIAGRALNWVNWSDRSALTVKDPIHNIYQSQLVYELTDKRIVLQAADRSPGSVQRRVDMTKRLLWENRLYVSRSRCPNLIDAFQALRKGKAGAAVDKHSKYKHMFDAASYAWTSECYDEVIHPRRDLNLGRASERSRLISVPL